MILGEVFERFLRDAPISVMFRSLMQAALDPADLDRLFDRNASRQYTREVLFSSLVALLGRVVAGIRPSVRAAYLAAPGEVAASLAAVYQKLQGVEPEVSRALVRHTADRLRPIIDRLGPPPPGVIPGYRIKVLDGNHLAPTQHRIRATRATRGAVPPGHALVVLDMAAMLIVDTIPCEDGHAQECTLIEAALATVAEGELWIADRGLCNIGLILGGRDRKACFLIRHDLGTLRWKPISGWGPESRIATGMVSEQLVEVGQRTGDRAIQARRIRLVLDKPTRSGEPELFLLTDLPGEAADAAAVALAYRRRWDLEHAFQVLTEALRCEIDTLAYPGAALLGFCLAIASYNILSAVRAALRAEHGAGSVDARVSDFHLAQEVASTYAGMMIALPPPAWEAVGKLGQAELVEFLREAASQARLARYPLSRHGPKRPPPRQAGRFNDHSSTARLIQQHKSKE